MKAPKHWQKQTFLFFLSQSITLFGSQIVQMAIVWYVTLQTESGAWVAAFSVCSYLPQFFISFIGGVWADRWNRKWLIIGADTLIALVTLGMLLMMPRITAQPVLLTALLGMSLLRSAGAGIQTPAVSAVIPQLVPQEELMRYNGINATMQSVVQFAAPAAAAVLLTVASLRSALLVDLLTAAAGVGLLCFVRLPDYSSRRENAPVWKEIAAGIRYSCRNKSVRASLAVYGLFLFWSVPAGYLAGLLVSRIFGDTYWYLTAVELVGFGGMMAGGILMSQWGGFKSRKQTLSAGLALFGLMAALMGMCRSLIPYLLCMAVYGVALTAVQTTITTLLQESTEPSVQGRIFGLMSALYASCYPFGMALFGPMADSLPLQAIMMVSGMALLLMAALVFFHFPYVQSNGNGVQCNQQ